MKFKIGDRVRLIPGARELCEELGRRAGSSYWEGPEFWVGGEMLIENTDPGRFGERLYRMSNGRWYPENVLTKHIPIKPMRELTTTITIQRIHGRIH